MQLYWTYTHLRLWDRVRALECKQAWCWCETGTVSKLPQIEIKWLAHVRSNGESKDWPVIVRFVGYQSQDRGKIRGTKRLLKIRNLDFIRVISHLSIDPSSTNKGKTNPSGLAFFCLLPRVCAGSCGFLRTAERAISASNRHLLLSVCVFSLRPSPPEAGRSPEGTTVTLI